MAAKGPSLCELMRMNTLNYSILLDILPSSRIVVAGGLASAQICRWCWMLRMGIRRLYCFRAQDCVQIGFSHLTHVWRVHVDVENARSWCLLQASVGEDISTLNRLRLEALRLFEILIKTTGLDVDIVIKYITSCAILRNIIISNLRLIKSTTHFDIWKLRWQFW